MRTSRTSWHSSRLQAATKACQAELPNQSQVCLPHTNFNSKSRYGTATCCQQAYSQPGRLMQVSVSGTSHCRG